MFDALDDDPGPAVQPDLLRIRRRGARLRRRRQSALAMVGGVGVLLVTLAVVRHAPSGRAVSTLSTAPPGTETTVTIEGSSTIDSSTMCTPGGTYLVTATITASGDVPFVLDRASLNLPGMNPVSFRLASGATTGTLTNGESASATASAPGSAKGRIAISITSKGATLDSQNYTLSGACTAR